MCGRYLIEEEAYSDILEILYRSGTLAPISHGAGGGTAGTLPVALKEAMAETMLGRVDETVSGDVKSLFPGAPVTVINGEVFPTNFAPVLTNGGVLTPRWGFPHWKDSSVIINARSETALEKKMFRESLLSRRCVILSNGFYEWDAGGSFGNIQIGMFGSGEHTLGKSGHKRGKKTKYLFRRPGEKKLYMAGFWNTFRDSGAQYNAFVVLTTAANDSISPIHSRMPLILSPDETGDWLNDTEFMQYALLRPGPELSAQAAA